jgi:hypothetical protein
MSNSHTSSVLRFSFVERLDSIAFLLIPSLMCVGVLLGLIPESESFGKLSAIITLGVLIYFIVLLLQGLSRIEAEGRELPENTGPEAISRITKSGLLFSMGSLMGLGFSFFLLGAVPKNWPGIALFVLACGTWATGIAKVRPIDDWRNKTLTADLSGFANDLQAYGKVRLRDFTFLIGEALCLALGVVFYFYLGGSQYFSLWDLAGFSFYFASATLWEALWLWRKQWVSRPPVR